MASQQGSARRPHFTSRAEKQRLREIAQLRARRAARRSTEVAAGKRRMVVSGFFATLTAAVGLLAALSTAVAWGWMLLPFGALVASLVVSRRAAIRFEEVSRGEQSRLEELMGLVPMGEADAVERREDRVASVQVKADASDSVAEVVEADAEADAGTAAGADAGADIEVGAAPEAAVEADVEDIVAAEAIEVGALDTGALEAERVEVVAEVAEVPVKAEPPAGAEASVESAPAAWVPTPIPAPMYAQRARVGGRLVHPDTDLRGIPKVTASVPMRPSGVSESDAPLRSTEEVVAAQPVSFDLDAILESRRAL